MARPTKATVDYFPHYVNHGKTMFTIESRYGNNGYAFWFKTLEILGSTEHHFIDCNKTEEWEFLLAKTRFTEDDAIAILDLLSNLGAISSELWSKKIIRSKNFIENLFAVYRRREINVYSDAQVLDYCRQKLPLSGVSVDINPQSIVKKSIVKKSKPNDIPLPEYLSNELWDSFMEIRNKQKKPPTVKAQELLLKKLEKLRNEGNDPTEVINQTIVNSWLSFYPLRDDKTGGNGNGTYKKRFGTQIPERDQYTRPEDWTG